MRSHANRGKQWEGVIDALHALYESMNIALCIRTPPNMKIVKAIKYKQESCEIFQISSGKQTSVNEIIMSLKKT